MTALIFSTKISDFGGRRSVTAVIVVVAVIAVGWLTIRSQKEILICDTATYGVRVELHRNPVLGRQRAVVLVEPGVDVLPGVPPRYELKSREQAEMFGIALASPGAPAVDIFSQTFRDQHCRH
jgi:hypothetical protein